MIATEHIQANASTPNFPLRPFVAYVGSPSQLRVVGLPLAIGNWHITAVQVTANYPDNTSQSVSCVKTGNAWSATIPASAAPGMSKNGYLVTADGVDENNNPVSGYVLGVGDVLILNRDSTITVGETTYYLHLVDETPDNPHKGDLDLTTGKVYDGTQWIALATADVDWDDVKPSGGVPKTDLASSVQASLGKADTALQPAALADYYTAEQTDEAIDKLAAYYITADAQGNPFATHAALVNAQTYYSGGAVRTPTRNDYAVVSADETHGGAEWRYIYAVDAQGVGQWEPQYAVEGVIAYDNTVTRTSANGVKSSGIWAAIWGALTAHPAGFTSLYDWVVDQLAGKLSTSGGTVTGDIRMVDGILDAGDVQTRSMFDFLQPGKPLKSLDAPENSGKALTDADLQDSSSALGVAFAGKQSALSQAQIDAVNSGITAAKVSAYDGYAATIAGKADAADLRYALTTKTISNGAVSLDDRAINAVAVSSSLASLTVNFPTATSGKARDFGVRLTVASGITTAPQLVLPQGVVCENADGAAPEIGADGAATILYFTETATGVFLVKGETVQTIS